ncbi:MAG: hypothetical protein UT50_C0009G0012 [Candidatus Moranbacteria bacterium GW2011_GWA2_39_41]|nr:MAG: hypothetical protein UT50_C0009G0012 [Candidatus Moranbacteria bacterium GW2011_GWA2_39_41]
MYNIKKIKLGLLLTALFVLMSCDAVLAEDVLNPNYGTTTFFSNIDEKPSNKPPMYDVGVKVGKKPPKDDGNKNDEKDKDGLFDQIIGGIGSLFGNSESATDSEKGSLFDLQKDSNGQNNSNSADSESGGEFIMGSRGESLDNLDDEEAARYASKFSSSFGFSNNGSSTAPKKSKLLFTNIIIPVDMTTQYVLIGFVFFIAVGSAVGYYLWKKEAAKDKKNYSEEDYQ